MPQNRTTVDAIGGNARALATSAAALVFQYVIQVCAGLYLARAYIPTPNQAHRTMVAILGAQPHAFIAGVHYWGTAILIVHAFLHLCALTFARWYRSPTRYNWYGAIALLLCGLLFQVTGNLLPFDRHGVQTTVVESGIAAGVPLAGPTAAHLMLQGEAFGPQTLHFMYLVHRWFLPFLMLVGFALVLSGRRQREAIVKPLILAPFVVTVIVALLLRTPLGTAATPEDYTSYGATVSWYVWPMHGAMQAFSHISPSLGWIGSAVLPTLFLAFLVFVPLLAKRMSATAVQATFAGFVLVFLALGMIFGGKFAPLTGTRDPVEAATDSASSAPGQKAPPMDAALAAKGHEMFNTVGCAMCHGQDGKHPIAAPSLATENQKHSQADWYVNFIPNPPSMKPSSTMPPFKGLSQDQLRALAEYLRNPH